MEDIKTEKDVLIEAAKRLNLLIEEFTTPNEITIRGYYDITIVFDDAGKIKFFDTHP